MRPVTQVRTGYGRGQCTEAAIASILECRLDEVPELWGGPSVPVDAPPEEQQPQENHERLWAWLQTRGFLFAWGEFSERPVPLLYLRFGEAFDDLPWAGFHLMAGPNPDGVQHMVVARGGGVAWDPNPSRRGITACSAVGFLLPRNVVSAEQWAIGSMGLHFEGAA